MNQNEREVVSVLRDIIFTAYTQLKDQEERMEMPLMIEVPVSWINLIRGLTPEDPFTTAELALREFFEAGVVSTIKGLQKLYASPDDIVRKYLKLIPK